jgi:hypothetical protein
MQIKISAFQLDACVMGGAALILRGILNNPLLCQPKAASPALLDENRAFAVTML